MVFGRCWAAASLGGLMLFGCGGAPQTPAPIAGGDEPAEGVFQAERAWADLNALAGAGPRPPGSEGADAARAYLVQALEGVGLEVEERSTVVELEGEEVLELTHLSVTIPGASTDRFVLVGSYDSDRLDDVDNPGVNLGASSAALLVELARVLSVSEPAYTLQLLFVEGDGRLGLGEGALRDRRGVGSALLAAQMQDAQELEGVRLLIAFKGVCDADLRIARDLLSHRHHREEFWRVARDLGYGEVFEREALFESVEASHAAFSDRGLRAVVAVADTVYGGTEPPGLYATDGQDVIDHCAPESLEVVGIVTLAAIDRIGQRLGRIDRFTRRPLAEPLPDVNVDADVNAAQPASPQGGESE